MTVLVATKSGIPISYDGFCCCGVLLEVQALVWRWSAATPALFLPWWRARVLVLVLGTGAKLNEVVRFD